jgi:hypothetical protein
MACVSVSQASAVGVEDGVEAGGEHVGGGMRAYNVSLTCSSTSPGVAESKVCETACSISQVVAITRVAGSPSRRILLLAA